MIRYIFGGALSALEEVGIQTSWTCAVVNARILLGGIEDNSE